MNVLGISGRDRDAAAALAVDGKVVSAVAEESFARIPGIGYVQAGGFPAAAVRACLERAGLDAADVHEVIVVDDGRTKPVVSGSIGSFQGIPVREVSAERADAWHAASTSADTSAVLVGGSDPASMAMFFRTADDLGPRTDIPGSADLVRAARRVAGLLGANGHDPFAAIDRLGHGGAAAFDQEFSSALRSGTAAIHADPDELAAAIGRIAGVHASNLADADSLNARLLSTRRDIAASFVSRLADVVTVVADKMVGGRPLAAGGALFGNPGLNTELSRRAPDRFAISPVPEAAGRAVGAAVSVGKSVSIADLALGPLFSEEDIKRTLDNCRLDYVYEPDWARLHARVSRMLGQGKLVAWFQGPMSFGPRSVGTRSILADPSNRYARQNVNEYLRQRPVDEPLPLAFSTSTVADCLTRDGLGSGVRDVAVDKSWQQTLASALDGRHAARIHGDAQLLEPQLGALIDHHFLTAGVPALIEVNLAGPGEPIACSPRDAVRTVYSSAIDALVIGRFLLMKDYWLLRTGDQ